MTSCPKLAELARDANVDFSEPLGTLSLVRARRPLIINTAHHEETARLIRLEGRTGRTISLFHRHTAISYFRYKAEHVESALFRLVQNNGSAAVAQCLLHQLHRGQYTHHKRCPSKAKKLPRGLLKCAANRATASIDLIHVLAPWADIVELTWALEATIDTANEDLISLLIHYGADPNQVQRHIRAAIVSNDRTLVNVLLSGTTPLSSSTFDLCLNAAIEGKDTRILTFLVQSPVVKRPPSEEGRLSWNRDGALRLAIETRQPKMLLAVAYHTSEQPLKDPSLYDAVLRTGVADPSKVSTMTQTLLYLDQDRCCNTFWGNNFPPYLDDGTVNKLLDLLISHGVLLSPAALAFAAARVDLDFFLKVLRNNKADGDEVWKLVNQLPVALQLEAREKVLTKLLTPSIPIGAWTQQALLFAVQARKPYIVTHLLMRQTNVNHNDGESISAALSNQDEAVFKLLMTRPLCEALLRATLRLVWNFQKDQKLAFMALLLKQNIPPYMISPLLDEALCNFNDDRDPRLIRVLVDSKATCSPNSLAVLIGHHDIGVLQYLLTTRAREKLHLRMFVNGSLKFLVKQIGNIDDSRLRDVVFQILDLHLSAFTRQGAVGLNEYFDLCEACRLGPIDSLLMKLFEKHQRFLTRISRLEASALIIRAQEISLARMFIDSWAAEVAFGNGVLKWQDLAGMIRHLAEYYFQDDKDKSLKLGYMLQRFRVDDFKQDLRADCLERHVRSLAQVHENDAVWPLHGILELLQKQTVFDDRLYSSLRMSAMHEQLSVMDRLLAVAGNHGAIGGDILRPLLRYWKVESLQFFIRRGLPTTLAFQAFEFVHREGHHDVAALLLKQATWHGHNEGCLCLKSLIRSPHSKYVSMLIRNHRFTSLDIDELWEHLALQPFELEKYSKVKLLLGRGLSLRFVQQTLLRGAHAQDNDLCRLVLQQRAPISKLAAKTGKSPARRTSTDFDCSYDPSLVMLGPSSLHQALKIAISTVNVELCDLLLDHKAPVVLNRSLLLRQAIETDTVPILRTILQHTSTAMRTRMLDESLWLGTCLNKPTLCAYLINQGASPLASDQRALKCAADRGLIDLLELFSLKDLPLYALENAFSRSQDTVLRMSVPLDQRLRVMAMFLKAGVSRPDLLSHALVSLTIENAPCREVAELLLSHGASSAYDGGSCLINAWRGNHLDLFKFLCGKLEDLDVAESCLVEVCAEFYAKSTNEANLLEVASTLMGFGLPKQMLNVRLVYALKAAVKASGSKSLVHLLLSKDAELIPDSASVLYDACASGDDRIIVEVFRHQPGPFVRLAAMNLLCSENAGVSEEEIKCMDLLLQDSEVVDRIDGPELSKWLRQALLSHKPSAFLASLLSRTKSDGNKLAALLIDSKGVALRKLLAWAIPWPTSDVDTDAIAYVVVYSHSDNVSNSLRPLSQLDKDPIVMMAMAYERPELVPTLLQHGADPTSVDHRGRSALIVALEKRHSNAAESLFLHSKAINDGSLHAATCSQHWKLIRWMVERGHSAIHRPLSHKHMTVLEAFLRHDHQDQHLSTLGFTIKLLSEICKGVDIWLATPNHLSVALNSKRPYQLTTALLETMPRWVTNLSEPHFRDDKYYSTLSLIERGQCSHLKAHERDLLVQRLERQGFRRAYYTHEGVQPDDAINVPEDIFQREDDRQRMLAYESNDCAVCMEKPQSLLSFFASIKLSCKPIHSWKDEIICTNCLVQHITANIFPDDIGNFAAAEPRCWAQSCTSTFSHAEIKALIQPDLFEKYDASLLQQTLHSTLSSARCANTTVKCIGGAWFDNNDLDELTFFRCPVCAELTCLLCNQLYSAHLDKPCPAGEAKKREAENKESEVLLGKIAKECECGARIQKTDGCDHMTCRCCNFLLSMLFYHLCLLIPGDLVNMC